jgi:hypothetical protein
VRNKNKAFLIISVLAFAAAIYFLLKGNNDPDGKGLRRFKVEALKGDSGWGYRISENNMPIIEQRSIPGIAGNKGFADEAAALKTGKLVETKMQMGIFPPSVSSQELDSLGVKY